MGRSRTPSLVVLEEGNLVMHGAPEWRVRRRGQLRGYGQPTAQNLARFVAAGNDSFKEGGVNFHITDHMRGRGELGPEDHARVTRAQIVRNDGSREILASWESPEA